jgi:hypothetical protein
LPEEEAPIVEHGLEASHEKWLDIQKKEGYDPSYVPEDLYWDEMWE